MRSKMSALCVIAYCVVGIATCASLAVWGVRNYDATPAVVRVAYDAQGYVATMHNPTSAVVERVVASRVVSQRHAHTHARKTVHHTRKIAHRVYHVGAACVAHPYVAPIVVRTGRVVYSPELNMTGRFSRALVVSCYDTEGQRMQYATAFTPVGGHAFPVPDEIARF
jgi:hypothetical protein